MKTNVVVITKNGVPESVEINGVKIPCILALTINTDIGEISNIEMRFAFDKITVQEIKKS